MGSSWVFAICSVASALALWSLVGIRGTNPPEERVGSNPFRSLIDGLRYVGSEPLVRAMVFMEVVALALFSSVGAMLQMFAASLQVKAPDLALLFNAASGRLGGIAALLALLLLSAVGDIRPKWQLAIGSAVVLGAAVFAFAYAPALAAATGLLVVCAVARQTVLTLQLTLIQLRAPRNVLGRIMGLEDALAPLTAVAAVVTDTFASVVGASIALSASAILATAVTALVAMRVPSARRSTAT